MEPECLLSAGLFRLPLRPTLAIRTPNLCRFSYSLESTHLVQGQSDLLVRMFFTLFQNEGRFVGQWVFFTVGRRARLLFTEHSLTVHQTLTSLNRLTDFDKFDNMLRESVC